MRVILLTDVKGIGRKYEEKNISDGHAINFLIPKKLAVPSSGSAAAQIKVLKEGESKAKEKEYTKLTEHITKLSHTEVVVVQKANKKDHLFAALTREKLSEIIKKEYGIEVDADCIMLEHGIKEVGTFTIPVEVRDKKTHFTLIVKNK